MSASAPWSVKGIDAKAREVAKDLARRSGMTLGEWLNQMILEGEDVGALISREKQSRDQGEAYAPEPLSRTRRPEPPRQEAGRAEPARRSAPYSSASAPLTSSDLRRRSIFENRPRDDWSRDDRAPAARSYEGRSFEERPRYDDGYEDPHYAPAASNDLGRVAAALESLGSRIETSETRSASAVRGVSHAVESLLSRLERSEAALAETQGTLTERTQESFERLSRTEEDQGVVATRLEQAERLIDAQAERLEGLSGHVREERERVARLEAQLKSPQALESVRAVEGALGKLANQLYEGDARTRDTLKDVREDMLGLSHRLAQIELRDPEAAAQGAIDKVVSRLAQRLEAAEAQTSGALRTLEQAFKALDGRLNRAEERGDVTDPEAVQSLSRLANDLSRRVEESRTELLHALQTGTQESIEKAMNALGERIDVTEKRSADAIEKMGQDVLRIADNLNRRVSGVETAVGAEVRRIADTVEQRFGRSEDAHAQALERLGGEIARISERLGAKLVESERRTAETVNVIGEHLTTQRDHINADFADRIRESEARTAKVLEEARARIDQKLAHVQTQSLLQDAEALKPAASAFGRAPDRGNDKGDGSLPNPFAGQFAGKSFAASKSMPIENVAFSSLNSGFGHEEADDEIEAEDEAPLDLTGSLLKTTIEDAAPDVRPEIRADFRPEIKSDFKPAFDPFEDEDPDADLLERSAHDVTPEDSDDDPFADIEVSRKTAPRAAAPFAARSRGGFDLDADEAPESAHADDDSDSHEIDAMAFEDEAAPTPVSVSTRDALAAARAAVRASVEGNIDDRGLGAFKAGRTRTFQAKASSKSGGTLVKAATASTLAVLIVSGGLGGYEVLKHTQDASHSNKTTADSDTTPIAAVAVAPNADPVHEQVLNNAYLAATQALEAHAPDAIDKLTSVANLGYAPAQFRLGIVYSGEGNYVKPNKEQARLWTQAAAEGGVPGAMNNLALMYYNGEAGKQDRTLAAMWFRKAAERGVLDSQYNLGILYQEGVGVEINPSEAYKWLSIAAKAGDHEAAKAATTVKAQLSEEQVAKVQDAVDRFVPISDGTAVAGASSSAPQG